MAMKGTEMCSVVIYDSVAGTHKAPAFVNEIPMRNVMEAVEYADQLAKETPERTYIVYNDLRQKVYQR